MADTEKIVVKNWSASKFECYKQCPWKFWCLHINKAGPAIMSKFINFGNTCHAVLDVAGKEEERPSREWIIEKTKSLWLPTEDDEVKFEEYKDRGYERWKFLGYKSRNEEIEFQKLALEMLFDYLLNRPFARPFKTEQWFTHDWINDLRLILKVDMIEVFDGNKESLVFDYNTNASDLKKREDFKYYTFKALDFKTGKNRLSKYQLRNDIATCLYAWAILKMFDFTEDDLGRFEFGHYYLRNNPDKGDVPGEVITELTPDHLRKAFHKMETFAYDAARGIFPKKEQFLCSYCEVEKLCKGK